MLVMLSMAPPAPPEAEDITKLQRSSAGNRTPLLYVFENVDEGPTKMSASWITTGLPEVIILVACILMLVEVLHAETELLHVKVSPCTRLIVHVPPEH